MKLGGDQAISYQATRKKGKTYPQRCLGKLQTCEHVQYVDTKTIEIRLMISKTSSRAKYLPDSMIKNKKQKTTHLFRYET